jgi:DNA-binding XRE family transcriptional regulator
MRDIQYKSTPQTRREAKWVDEYLDGRRDDIPGYTGRILLAPAGIKKTRIGLRLTQKSFASLLKVQLITVQSWEQGQRSPDNTAALIILLLAKHKQVRKWLEALSPPQKPSMA